jgi:hypothetical protein
MQTEPNTAYKYPIKSQTELETEFKRLAEEWRIDTGMLSNVLCGA